MSKKTLKFGAKVICEMDGNTGIIMGRSKLWPDIVVMKLDDRRNWTFFENKRYDNPDNQYSKKLKEGDQCEWYNMEDLTEVIK